MEALIVIVMILGLPLAVVVGWMLARRAQPEPDDESQQQLTKDLTNLKSDLTQAVDNSGRTLLNQINALETRVNQRFEGVQGKIDTSLDGTQLTMKDVNERLGQLSVSTQQMLEIGQDMSSLQDILRPPKLRGGFGETLLGQLLANVLPQEHYDLQYSFRSGQIVDAVVRMKQGLIPVDSKFPLEGFERMQGAQSDEERERERRGFIQAVKRHVDSVTKYIKQDEGTLPFVVMYIPSEAVFYEVIVRDELTSNGETMGEYVRGKSVLAASPGTFYNLLQTVSLGLRGLEVEERAREIIDHLGRLEGDFKKVKQDFGTLGKHIDHAKTKYEEVNRGIDGFDVRLNRPLDDGNQPQLAEPAVVDTAMEQQALPGSESEEPSIPGPLRVNGGEDS